MNINCDGIMCSDCPIWDHEKMTCRAAASFSNQVEFQTKLQLAQIRELFHEEIDSLMMPMRMALKCMEQRVNIIEDKLGIKSNLRAYPEKKRGGK